MIVQCTTVDFLIRSRLTSDYNIYFIYFIRLPKFSISLY
jgi:hypothetical protein